MPTGSAVSTDFYAVLGVDETVGGDDIARAFRARAKTLHPDTSRDPDAARKFNDLVFAYVVLSNHRTRRDYDQSRRARPAAGVPTTAGSMQSRPGPAGARSRKEPRWSRRKAWTAVIAGALVALLGLGAAWLTWQLHAHDARTRARYVPVTALRSGTDDGVITFTTAANQVVRTKEPEQHGEGSDLGPTVKVRYDPVNPTQVIVDSSTIGRDITLAIVSLKLLIGGLVFVVLGGLRLRRRDEPATSAR